MTLVAWIVAWIVATAVGAIVAIWFGYPLVVRCVAALVGSPCRPNYERARERAVTVVLATRERPQAIVERVRNLLDSDHPADRLEVVVALDAEGALSSPQQLNSIDPRVRVVASGGAGGKAAALNSGVLAASGEVLVLADTAQRFDRRTIPELVASLEDSRFGAVSGALSLGAENGARSPVHIYWAIEKWLRYNESLIHSCIGVTGAVYATRTALWPTIPIGTLLDDVYVPMSLVLSGHRVAFTYRARAVDLRTFDADAEGARKSRTLTGVMQLLQLLPDVMSRRNPVRLQFVLHKLARLATPALALLTVGASIMLLVLLLLRYPRQTVAPAAITACAVVMVPSLRRRALRAIRWGVTLQVATVRAIRNGVRGEWAVWQNSK